MASSISSVTYTQPVAPSTGTSTHNQSHAERRSTSITDTVQLSKTAQALLDALKEAQETPDRTAVEAANGDLQAQRLLAREYAQRAYSG
jgi:hypothetical protein